MGPLHSSCAAAVALLLGSTVAGQISWQPAPPLPIARSLHCGAFDSARNRLVIHGGLALGSVLADTWEYDGATWQQVSSPTSPGPRWAASMAYDPVTQTTILFGGSAVLVGYSPNAQTWRWNGTTWSLLQPAQSPPALLRHAMATDMTNNRIVLFGGQDVTGTPTAQTWTFDGTTWSQLVGPQPPARVGHDLAQDLNSGNLVLFGGFDYSISLGDTWELVANAWIQRSPVQSPGARWGHGMASIPPLGGVVLHGGNLGGTTPSTASSAETWWWNGSIWQMVPLTGQYLPLWDMVLQADVFNGRVMMVAGYNAGPLSACHTLTITDPGAYVASGGGCPGPAGTPQLSGLGFPWVGAVAYLLAAPVPLLGWFVLGTSNTISGGAPLPLSLGAIGMPGCTLQVSVDVILTVTPTGGQALVGVPIPLLPSLVGFTFYAQASSWDPGANPLELTLSNALAVTIGGV